jgi:hypothetical protein
MLVFLLLEGCFQASFQVLFPALVFQLGAALHDLATRKIKQGAWPAHLEAQQGLSDGNRTGEKCGWNAHSQLYNVPMRWMIPRHNTPLCALVCAWGRTSDSCMALQVSATTWGE